MKDLSLGGSDEPIQHGLPAYIFEHLELEDLTIATSYDFISPDIERFKQLIDLSVIECPVGDSSMENICRVGSLESLFIEFTNITCIPTSIRNLKNLKSICLWFSPLKYIAPEIGLLSQLEDLSFRSTPLESLPSQLFELPALKTAVLWLNHIQNLPEESAYSSPLETLWLQSNKLTSLPESFGHLSCLRQLKLDSNLFKQIPACLQKLGALEELGLSSNGIAEVPLEIFELPCLQTLNLSSNQLTQVPVFHSQTLRALDLQRNPIPQLSAFTAPALEELFADAPTFLNTPLNILLQWSALQKVWLRGTRAALTPGQLKTLEAFQAQRPEVKLELRT